MVMACRICGLYRCEACRDVTVAATRGAAPLDVTVAHTQRYVSVKCGLLWCSVLAPAANGLWCHLQPLEAAVGLDDAHDDLHWM